MAEFLTGITDKYIPQLLKGRIQIEGNVISSFFKDMLLLDEVKLEPKDFITSDGHFYYSLLMHLRKKGFYTLDEVTILSNCSEEVIDAYNERGGFDTIQHQIDIINVQNFDTYIDILYRENILCNMHLDGFNLITPIMIGEKKVAPLKLLRKMTAEEVIDWYESRIETYGCGYTSKILEEEEVNEFTDEFIQDCIDGVENGVPFDQSIDDINLEPINCFPFLSRQINGLLPGTLSMLGGYSSTGKSTYMITVIMALLHRGRKVLIITNEEDVKRFKCKFLIWMLAKYCRYYKLTKKKLTSGNITDEDREMLKEVQEIWKENFSHCIKIISVADADMSTVKKKIRESVLRFGYDTVLYDTFKIQEEDMTKNRSDLALVKDSRDLHKLAKKYNIIMLATVQLSEYTKGKLFLDASVLSNCKALKEICENLLMLRNVYEEEKDPKSKHYCRPYKLKKVNDKWVEEQCELDSNATYKMLFVEKCRAGANSSDTGSAYILRFDGDHCVFREQMQCKPRHGQIT